MSLGGGVWGLLGHRDIGNAGDQVLVHEHTQGTHPEMSGVQGHREVWGAGALILGYGGMWGSGASGPRHRDTWGLVSHGGHRAPGLARHCYGHTGSMPSSGIQWEAPGITRAPQPVISSSVPRSLCPPLIPLSSPSALTSLSVLLFLCLCFLQSLWISLLSLLLPSCSFPDILGVSCTSCFP